MTETASLHPKVAAVVTAARQQGVEIAVREFPAGTRTAADAAAAIGVAEAQIVKSLVFRVDDDVVVALVSGPNRVDESRLADAVDGRRVVRADADQVRDATGFPIGGVPPFGHTRDLPTLVDHDLLDHDVVWAAAGTPRHVFPLSPSELMRLSRATPAALAVGSERDWVRIVAEQTCDECGLRATAVARDELPEAIDAEGTAWRDWLTTRVGDAGLRRRPDPSSWSALEYAAHVRDLLAIFTARARRALVENEPDFGWWDHDAAADNERYNEQDPSAVAVDLAGNAGELRGLLAGLGTDREWARAGIRRSRERFTVEDMARFTLHEARHHRVDAMRSLDGSVA